MVPAPPVASGEAAARDSDGFSEESAAGEFKPPFYPRVICLDPLATVRGTPALRRRRARRVAWRGHTNSRPPGSVTWVEAPESGFTRYRQVLLRHEVPLRTARVGTRSESEPTVEALSIIDTATPSELSRFWHGCHFSGRVRPFSVERMHAIPQ